MVRLRRRRRSSRSSSSFPPPWRCGSHLSAAPHRGRSKESRHRRELHAVRRESSKSQSVWESFRRRVAKRRTATAPPPPTETSPRRVARMLRSRALAEEAGRSLSPLPPPSPSPSRTSLARAARRSPARHSPQAECAPLSERESRGDCATRFRLERDTRGSSEISREVTHTHTCTRVRFYPGMCASSVLLCRRCLRQCRRRAGASSRRTRLKNTLQHGGEARRCIRRGSDADARLRSGGRAYLSGAPDRRVTLLLSRSSSRKHLT